MLNDCFTSKVEINTCSEIKLKSFFFFFFFFVIDRNSLSIGSYAFSAQQNRRCDKKKKIQTTTPLVAITPSAAHVIAGRLQIHL